MIQARPARLAALFLTSFLFFILVGPAVGAIVFFAQIGPVTALMTAHAFGSVPAFMTGILNALAIMLGIVRSRSLGGRFAHGVVGALCGFLTTVLFLDYPDWVLIQRTTSGYDFWYTFNRSYVEMGMAGLFAGGVCSFLFNPWTQRLIAS